MTRGLLTLAVVAVAACGGSGGPAGLLPGASKPATAKSVGLQPGDVSGSQLCPESGDWETYLDREQVVNLSAYEEDTKDWAQLKSGGATEGYITVYAENTAECGLFSQVDAPKGRVVFTWVVKFNDSDAASLSYKTYASSFSISPADLADLKAQGGTVAQGQATGLGDNSLTAAVSFQGTAFYAAFWQSKSFETMLWGYNMGADEGGRTTHLVNGRIH
jgi:hypothetical protein